MRLVNFKRDMETYNENTERWLFVESLKDERWVRIKEHPLYFVSNYGRIKSDTRKTNYACHGELNAYRICKSKILKLNQGIYLSVGLKDSGKVKQKKYNVHRLVAMAFLPNPEVKPF